MRAIGARIPIALPVTTVADLFPPVVPFEPLGVLEFDSFLWPLGIQLLGGWAAVVAKDEQCHTDDGTKIANRVTPLDDGGWGSITWEQEKAALTGENGLTAEDLDALKMLREGGDGTQCGDTTDTFNCHGLTFSCGMRWICNDEVDTILMKNGYMEVAAGMAMVGDVCVFRDADGDVIHTETVTEVDGSAGPGVGSPTKSNSSAARRSALCQVASRRSTDQSSEFGRAPRGRSAHPPE